MPVRRKLLVANRGEIAVRILRAAREIGWTGVAVYSEADRGSLHVRMADEAYPIGPAPPAQSYLNAAAVLEAARRADARFIHPGYGFLAENAGFARAVEEAGFIFVGPSPDAVAAMGDKIEARRFAAAAGVPVTPGTGRLPPEARRALPEAHRLGYPVLVKAAFGGGGRGMRLCRDDRDVVAAVETAGSEARRAFGDGTLYMEKWIESPRHVEVQILADPRGEVLHLGERECSIQRRHQKLIEETPSPAVEPALRRRMTEAAVELCRAIRYRGVGTVEYLLDRDGSFTFLEMNTRLQVEHPVTEMVHGLDLVKAQLVVAQGKRLPWRQEEIVPRGHSIEVRVCAEDPVRGFAPQAGRLRHVRLPAGPGIRNDMGVACDSEIPVAYDSLMGKVISWGIDREEARIRLLRGIEETILDGVVTNLPFHRWALSHPRFVRGDISTKFIEEEFEPEALEGRGDLAALAVAAALAAREERFVSGSPARAPQAGPSPWSLAGRPGRGR